MLHAMVKYSNQTNEFSYWNFRDAQENFLSFLVKKKN